MFSSEHNDYDDAHKIIKNNCIYSLSFHFAPLIRVAKHLKITTTDECL